MASPREHPVSRLWELHRAERGAAAPCRVCLAPDAGAALSPGTETEELARLERLLTDTGWARVRRVTACPGGLPDLDAQAVLFLPQDGLSAWVFVYPPTGRGRELSAATLLRANVIGARNELATQVALGGRPCEDWERSQVLGELERMERDREAAARQPDGPEKQQMASLRLKAAVSRLRLDQLGRRPAREASGAPLAAGHVYPGAVISIDGVARAVEREETALRAALERDRVRFFEGEGESGGAGTDP